MCLFQLLFPKQITLTLIMFQPQQDHETTTGMESQYFNQLMGSVILLEETKTPDSSNPHRQVVNGPAKNQGIGSNLHWQPTAPSDTSENITHTAGKKPNCLHAAAALFQKNQELSLRKS